MNRLRTAQRVAVVKALVEGNSAGVFFLVQLGLLLNTSPEQEEAVGRAADLGSAAGMTFLNVYVVVGYALTPRLLLAWRKPVDAADQSYPHR